MLDESLVPAIERKSEMKFVGLKIEMSFTKNRTHELWRSFMPRRKEIEALHEFPLFSIEQYPAGFFNPFDSEKRFVKWAAMRVDDFISIPKGMATLISPEGLFAIFIHKGRASEGSQTYEFIFRIWLPNSGYLLDDRPHFAVMGEKYKQESSDSEEEIWIPIRKN